MPEKPSPEDFDRRLREARARESDKAGTPGLMASSGVGQAFRIGTELLAALVVGLGIGYLLDRWLGTRPWLLILFFFLGSAAGILNVWRAMSGTGPFSGR